MKRKKISVEIRATVNLGNYENVAIGTVTEGELEPGDDRKECRRELAREARDFIAEELDNWKN